ncbi:MAG: OmpA family protein [Alphaproteobacteria bacterium]
MRAGLMIAVALAIALLVFAPIAAIRDVEADLSGRSQGALRGQGIDWAAVAMDGRTVVLSGEAPDEAESARAATLVAGLRGVAGVVSAVEVAPARDYPLMAAMHDGALTLRGEVPDQDALDALSALAHSLPRVEDVALELTIAGGTALPDWRDIALQLVEQGAQLVDGTAALTADGIVLEGLVADAATRDSIGAAFADREGRPASVTLELLQPQDYALAISRAPDRLTLTGVVPDRTTRAELADLAQRQGTAVVDTAGLTIAPGLADPEWAVVAAALIRQAAGMQEAEIRYSAAGLTVSGTVADPALADVVRSALASVLGPDAGVPVEIDIAVLGGAPVAATPDDAIDADACQAALNGLVRDGSVRFVNGGATLDPASTALLETVASTMLRCPDNDIEVSGHTDSSGDAAENLALSEARARAVVDALVARGVAADRLIAAGYGDLVPIADNATEAGRARNRRIEFIVEPGER